MCIRFKLTQYRPGVDRHSLSESANPFLEEMGLQKFAPAYEHALGARFCGGVRYADGRDIFNSHN
jgi:hypothetical protein